MNGSIYSAERCKKDISDVSLYYRPENNDRPLVQVRYTGGVDGVVLVHETGPYAVTLVGAILVGAANELAAAGRSVLAEHLLASARHYQACGARGD